MGDLIKDPANLGGRGRGGGYGGGGFMTSFGPKRLPRRRGRHLQFRLSLRGQNHLLVNGRIGGTQGR